MIDKFKVSMIRSIPEIGDYPYRLIGMQYDGKGFYYFNDGHHTTFEVYFWKDGKPEKGHYYSRCYDRSKCQAIPYKYTEQFLFLQSEFQKVNWNFSGEKTF